MSFRGSSKLIRSYHIFWETFTPPTYKNTQSAFYSRSRNPPRMVGVSAPSSAAKAGDAVSPVSPPTLSGVLSLVFLHLHTKISYRLQVSRTSSLPGPNSFLHVCRTSL
jgi:hypothetical protein